MRRLILAVALTFGCSRKRNSFGHWNDQVDGKPATACR